MCWIVESSDLECIAIKWHVSIRILLLAHPPTQHHHIHVATCPGPVRSVSRLSYKRSIRSTATDPFKRAVYCLLGSCDASDEHSDVATSLDDYLWIKLSQISHDDDGGTLAAAQNPGERITLLELQHLLSEEYGEGHFKAFEQPCLYFQVRD